MNKEQANFECLKLNNSLDRNSNVFYRVVFNVKTNSYEIKRFGNEKYIHNKK